MVYMESEADPSVFEDRLYYKIGLFVHDYANVVLISSLLLCAGLGYMITLEPKYIEGYGEGDLESVDGWEAAGVGFSIPTKRPSSPSMSFSPSRPLVQR